MDIPQSLKDWCAIVGKTAEEIAAITQQYLDTGYFTDGVASHWGHKPEAVPVASTTHVETAPVVINATVSATVNGESVPVETPAEAQS